MLKSSSPRPAPARFGARLALALLNRVVIARAQGWRRREAIA